MASKTENWAFDVSGQPTIRAKNNAGQIAVTGGDGAQVAVRVTRRHSGNWTSGDESDLDQVRVQVAQEGDTITVVAETGHTIQMGGRSVVVDIEITAPRSSRLDLNMNAGQVEVRDSAGPLSVKMGAGQVDLHAVRVAESSRLDVATGQIRGDVALGAGASLDVSVSAGQVSLDLPSSTSAEVEASVSVGQVTVHDLPIDVSRRLVAAHARGRLGDGSGHLTIKVATGAITLRAR